MYIHNVYFRKVWTTNDSKSKNCEVNIVPLGIIDEDDLDILKQKAIDNTNMDSINQISESEHITSNPNICESFPLDKIEWLKWDETTGEEWKKWSFRDNPVMPCGEAYVRLGAYEENDVSWNVQIYLLNREQTMELEKKYNTEICIV